ncbi:MAG: hypothetical protein R3C44_12550 [Chloroflexota bacterium]
MEQFKAAAEPYWQELWSDLPPTARASLSVKKGLAVDPTFAGHQLRNLRRKGIVQGTGKKTRLFSKGFAEWTRAMQQATQLSREANSP